MSFLGAAFHAEFVKQGLGRLVCGERIVQPYMHTESCHYPYFITYPHIKSVQAGIMAQAVPLH